jgi:hypothetical protein
VRQCVCVTWDQLDCCTIQWTDYFCEMTATKKCNGTAGCSR